ncbi:MAG TPA: histidine phosphatase family protein [Casimicrobiaceae bacterium]|nr:histidine phosphatase family protein [Casimicrobiaceae bacterium]
MNLHSNAERRSRRTPLQCLAEILTCTIALVFAAAGHAADSLPASELAKPGRLLMLRHANAPGIGDPPGFTLGDCSTQRNLDAAGRAQAARLGERMASAGIAIARLYSSQWCRCLETARLLGLGAPTELPALNSFFGREQERDANISALRAFLSALPIDGPPVVLVTHQFTIGAFAGSGTASGGGTIFALNGTGTPRVLGEIQAD